MKNFKRNALLAVGVGIGSYAGICIHFERKVLSRDSEKRAYDPIWLKQIEFEEFWIQSKDHLKLRGLYIRNPFAITNQTVVIAHGYRRQIERMDQYGKGFYQLGYHVLMIDLRSHGMSQGRTITFGKRESDDVLLWLDQMLVKNPTTSFILFGMSMGAATMIHTAAKAVKYPIVALIEDCGFSRFDLLVEGQIMEQRLKAWIVPGFKWAIELRLRNDLKKMSPVYALEKGHVPVLIIHGSKDQLIPVGMAYDLYEHANEPKQLYICEGKGHGECILDEHYFETIRLFLNESEVKQ